MLGQWLRIGDARHRPRRRILLQRTAALLAGGLLGARATDAQPAEGQTSPDPISFTHLSMCVADLERALRFYCDVLGFEKASEPRSSAPDVAALVGLSGDVRFWLQRARRDGITLQFMKFDAPSATGAATARPMNLLGVTHLSFRVQDFEATLARVRRAGGAVLEESLTQLTTSRVVFCTDADGTRIEILSPLPARRT